MSDPWLKFFTSDWRSDPRLRLCSIAARGLWVEMICLMHEATPYGHLLINGRSPTDGQISALVGAAPDECTALLGELDSAGVFSRTRDGTIYSRKLTRMAKKAAVARNNGRRGGNPTLCNEYNNKPLDNQPDKGGVKPQKPELESDLKEIKAKAFTKKTGTRIPENWVLPKDWGEWAVSEGYPEAGVRNEAAKFHDYWKAKSGRDATKLDWAATWRNWMRNSKTPKAINGGYENGKPASKSAQRIRAWTEGARGTFNAP